MTLPEPLIIIGAGEHARVVADAVALLPDRWRLIGVAAPDGEARAAQLGVRWFPDDVSVHSMLPEARLILGVGQVGVSQTRSRIVRHYEEAGAVWATVIHPTAIVSRSAEIHPGAVVLAGAVVNPGASIGSHVIINTRAVIEHDCDIGRFACIAPGVILGGGVHVGESAFLGLAACVRDHVRIGAGVLVGMGAVVTRDFAEAATVLGNPARAHPFQSKT